MNKHKRLIEAASLYLDKELPLVTCMANLSSLIYHEMENINWVGFYLFNGKNLYLGPFQGKTATVSIDLGSGVCGVAAVRKLNR